MIQRIQSLWLLLATVAILIVFKLPYSSFQNGAGAERLLFVSESLVLYILSALLALGSFVTIFLFKRRSKQKRLIWLSILSCILFIVLMYFDLQNNKGNNVGQFKLGAIAPLLYIILLGAAYSGVSKDDKLVKSTRRLR